MHLSAIQRGTILKSVYEDYMNHQLVEHASVHEEACLIAGFDRSAEKGRRLAAEMRAAPTTRVTITAAAPSAPKAAAPSKPSSAKPGVRSKDSTCYKWNSGGECAGGKYCGGAHLCVMHGHLDTCTAMAQHQTIKSKPCRDAYEERVGAPFKDYATWVTMNQGGRSSNGSKKN